MKTLGVIPARFASTRLPGKPLADIHGHPMLWHVYNQSLKAGLDHLTIATDSSKIQECCEQYDIPCLLTRSDHECGTDRAQEVATLLPEYDFIINIQGDEPLINPALIAQLAETIVTAEVDIATPYCIISPEEAENSNTVKVVVDNDNNALYFSRSMIPFQRNNTATYKQHIGLYAYTLAALNKISALPPSEYEQVESLEQLRALHNGMTIRMVETTYRSVGVDTQEDLELVRTLLATAAS